MDWLELLGLLVILLFCAAIIGAFALIVVSII